MNIVLVVEQPNAVSSYGYILQSIIYIVYCDSLLYFLVS